MAFWDPLQLWLLCLCWAGDSGLDRWADWSKYIVWMHDDQEWVWSTTGAGTKWTFFIRSWCHTLVIITHFFAPSLHVLFFFLVALQYFLLFLIFCSLNLLLACISQINFLTLSRLCWCAIFLHFLLMLSLISIYKCFCFIIIWSSMNGKSVYY